MTDLGLSPFGTLNPSTSILKIHPADNVAVALQALSSGCSLTVEGKQISVGQDIPMGHKVALRPIETGEHIIKYGFPIGHASRSIKVGEWVNEHNLETNLSGTLSYAYHPKTPKPRFSNEDRTFMGYRRRDGSVGVRNELWIIPTVGCVNGICSRLAEEMRRETGAENIYAFTHNYGCSQLGDDHENTRRILSGLVHHPNAGAVLVVGLGCENNQPADFERFCADYDRERVHFITTQHVEGDEMEACRTALRELYSRMQQDRRTPCPLADLRIGLKCGGSDGFSGITANPLLGVLSDYLVAQNGSVVLTEVPEMFGAETILMDRCASEDLFRQTVRLINDFKDFYLRHGEPVGENPSPGNKAGGITTLEEKSLGCVQKCGTSLVCDVLDYGERLRTNGLSLLSAPGNDLVASTALAAAGCQIVLFTTGRGTPLGTVVPTLKISTNSALYRNKPHWVDFDAGSLADGEDMASLFRRFLDLVIQTADGRPARNESNGYREMAIFKTGVTL